MKNKNQLAIEWLDECLRHLTDCADESCNLYWSFAFFLKNHNVSPQQEKHLIKKAHQKLEAKKGPRQ